VPFAAVVEGPSTAETVAPPEAILSLRSTEKPYQMLNARTQAFYSPSDLADSQVGAIARA